jgi:hypothetical protein
MPYANQDFEREKLYEEIWSEPVSKVSKRYQISDVGLRKICIGLNIPVPPAGHWAKVAAGKIVKRPPLPLAKGPTTYQRSVFKNPRDDELSTRAQARINEDTARAPEVPAISVRTTVDECLPLVKRMAKKLDGEQLDSRTWPYCEGAGLMRIFAYFTPSWTAISRQAGQTFHAKLDTDFTASWTAISHEAGQ